MKEVEAKAWLEFIHVFDVLSDLKSLQLRSCVVDKCDRYYRDENDEIFRIRRENGILMFNKKKQNNISYFECNDEIEYEISADDEKKIIAQSTLFMEKQKSGYKFMTTFKDYDSNIELVFVDGLGIFLEIEVLLDDDAKQKDIKDATGWIEKIFEKYNLLNNIEKRKYIDMLSEKRR